MIKRLKQFMIKRLKNINASACTYRIFISHVALVALTYSMQLLSTLHSGSASFCINIYTSDHDTQLTQL